jgi:hypothetical protein
MRFPGAPAGAACSHGSPVQIVSATAGPWDLAGGDASARLWGVASAHWSGLLAS